jgi:thiol-disulfide isomerase/thioredoxin
MAADAKVGDASFRVGVIDYDCNASYSDRGHDRILVGETGQEILSAHLSGGATTIDEETLILARGKVFEIVEVDSAGGFLKLQPSDKPWTRLAQGMPLPSLSIELLNGEKKDLSSFVKPDHYLLIDFWGTWCGGCIAAIPNIKDLQSKWKDRLTVLGLHSGDPEAARRMVQKKGVDWEQAIATKDLQERFLVDGFPSYILVGPDGKIVQLRTDPAHVGTILRSAR